MLFRVSCSCVWAGRKSETDPTTNKQTRCKLKVYGLVIAETLRRLHPQAWEKGKFNALLFNTPAFKAFLNGATAEDLTRSWQADIAAFRERRRPYLLYA